VTQSTEYPALRILQQGCQVGQPCRDRSLDWFLVRGRQLCEARALVTVTERSCDAIDAWHEQLIAHKDNNKNDTPTRQLAFLAKYMVSAL